MKTLAVIPARGGSKRIPLKNIRMFHGKPIIAWSIEAAEKSGLFDRIIVSTDSEQIAQVAVNHGAEVPFMRPVSLADDYTGTNAVVRHCLKWLTDRGETTRYACCIYPTAPFLRPEFLHKGFETMHKYHCAYVFTVTSFSFPILRAVRITARGSVEAVFPEHISNRSQDLEETFHDAGQFYLGTQAAFLDNVPIYSSDSRPVVLPRYLVQDIDTPEDWEMAEHMFAALQKETSA